MTNSIVLKMVKKKLKVCPNSGFISSETVQICRFLTPDKSSWLLGKCVIVRTWMIKIITVTNRIV